MERFSVEYLLGIGRFFFRINWRSLRSVFVVADKIAWENAVSTKNKDKKRKNKFRASINLRLGNEVTEEFGNISWIWTEINQNKN